MNCLLCDEEVDPDDRDVREMGSLDGGLSKVHRPCLLRAGVGGWGHHVDHAYWCVQMHDPDGGLSYRESALRVDELYASRRNHD